MLLMIEKKLREEYVMQCISIKANNKYMKDDDTNKESLYLRI